MFLSLVAFALLVVLLFYGWGVLQFVCSDNNHSFRGDNEQPVYYSSLTNVVHVYGKQNPEDQY